MNLSLDFDVVGGLFKLKVPFALGDFGVIEEPGGHPLLLGDGLLDLGVPPGLGLAYPGVPLHLRSPGHPQGLQVPLSQNKKT